MDIYTISLIIIPPFCTGIGFFVKYYFDRITKNNLFIKEKRLKEVEQNLEDFYFQIFINFLREEVIWKKIISNHESIDDKFKIELDKEILDTHLENQKIIKNNLIKVNPSEEMYKLLMVYEEHITIFNILRSINKGVENFDDYKFPYYYGSPYPREIVPRILEELESLKMERHELYSSMV